MTVRYFKRYKMEIDLRDVPPVPALPDGYAWVGWDESLIGVHADVKFRSFHEEIDATVFPSLSDRQGCFYLMNEIAHKRGFVPQATWLVAIPGGYCGTVQGLRDPTGMGAIQNLGVTPTHRGRGLGAALLLKALDGFRRCTLDRAFLEVTALNDGAVQLYRRLGFRCRKTVYRAVEVPLFAGTPDRLSGPTPATRREFID